MLVWFITYPSKLLGLRGSRLSSSRSEMTTSLRWGPHTELWTKMGRNSGPNSHPPKSRDPRAGEKTSVWPCYGRREDSSAERQGRRGASQAQRRPSPPSTEEARRRVQGGGAQRLSSYSCRGQSTAPAGWETGPLVVQVNVLAPGIQMMALLQTITELLCLASWEEAGLITSHPMFPFICGQGHPARGTPSHTPAKQEGGCLYGKSYKNATFPWGETCYMTF